MNRTYRKVAQITVKGFPWVNTNFDSWLCMCQWGNSKRLRCKCTQSTAFIFLQNCVASLRGFPPELFYRSGTLAICLLLLTSGIKTNIAWIYEELSPRV